MEAALYARVSTDQQTTQNQLAELRAVAKRMGWKIVAEFVDHGVSGAKDRTQRPQFDALLKGVTRREFDVIAAWSVDRLGRSLQHLVSFLDEIHGKRVDLYLHQQGIDTTTVAGKGAVPDVRCVCRVRVGDDCRSRQGGLGPARAQGKTLGRPMVGAAVEAKVKRLRRKGLGMNRIARELEIGTGTVQRILQV